MTDRSERVGDERHTAARDVAPVHVAASDRAPSRRRSFADGIYGVTPRRMLTLAFLVNVLLFVRVAVLYEPDYSYRGPSGADRVYYYAYTRSLVIDHDLDLTNEFAMRPPSTGMRLWRGRPTNKYPIGAPALAVPLFGLVHFMVRLADSLGLAHVDANGYSAPYTLAYALSQMAWAMFGMYLLYRAASEYFPGQIAALATIAAWFSTAALRFTSVDLMMSHAAALFSVGWCSYEAVTLVKAPQKHARWLRLGASAAFLILVRYQDGVYLLVPAVAALSATSSYLVRLPIRRAIGYLLASAGAFGLMFVPQLLAWHSVFGSWFANSYGEEGFGAAAWLRPHMVAIFFDRAYGLRIWLPAILLGLIGCFTLAAKRRDLLPAAAGLAWLINAYVTATFAFWPTNIFRSGFDLLFPLVLGFGFVIWQGRQRAPVLTLAVVGLLMVWSVPFASISGVPVAGADTSYLTGWMQTALALAHADRVLP